MARKSVMGRNLNALLGGGSRAQSRPAGEAGNADSEAAVHPGAGPAVKSGVQPSAHPGAAAIEHAPSVAPDKPLPPAAPGRAGDRLKLIGVERIGRGEFQPRRHFDQALLEELADSLRAHGLIQPILVRAQGEGYELIAGERRWRAAQLAGLHEIPAIVRDLEDRDVAAIALIENIQRKDLNPLEEAEALRRLCDDFGMTHQQVAASVGRSRVAVSNLMRLLELDEAVKRLVDLGELDMGRARALLGAPVEAQAGLAARIIKQRLSTRATEKLVRDLRNGAPPSASPASPGGESDPDIDRLAERLSGLLGAPVRFHHRRGGTGTLEIRYASVEALEGILEHIR